MNDLIPWGDPPRRAGPPLHPVDRIDPYVRELMAREGLAEAAAERLADELDAEAELDAAEAAGCWIAPDVFMVRPGVYL